MTDTKSQNRPSHAVFVRRYKADGQSELGAQIGVGFSHSGENAGLNVVLDAAPIPRDGRIDLVIFPIKSKKE